MKTVYTLSKDGEVVGQTENYTEALRFAREQGVAIKIEEVEDGAKLKQMPRLRS